MDVLKKTDERLAFINDFNKRLGVIDTALTDLDNWLLEGRKRIDAIIEPKADLSPEDRVTKSMEVQEDLLKKSDFTKKQETEKEDIFPKGATLKMRTVPDLDPFINHVPIIIFFSILFNSIHIHQ